MRRTEPQLTADAIVEAASHLFRSQGYRKARLEDVAAVFGVTRPALYYHFKNKQEILVQIHTRAMTGLLAGAEAVRAAGDPLPLRFRRLIANHMAFVASNGVQLGIVYEEEAELPKEHRERTLVLRRQYTNMLVEQYQQGIEEGHFRPADPKLAIFTLLGACNWVYRWYREGGPLTAEELAATCDQLLANGYLIRPDTMA